MRRLSVDRRASTRRVMSVYACIYAMLGLGTLYGTVTPLEAVEPDVWRQDSQEEFIAGEPQNVSLTREGEVLLAPGFGEVADTGEQFVWALARDGAGRLYAATGNEGKVFRVKDDGSAELLYDSPEVALFSLAATRKGVLYAGSSPDGIIYRLAPGKDAQTFCETGDQHVWALVAGSDGSVYAATGGKQGRVLKIDSKGRAEELYTTADPNVVSLIRAADGTLYAGTDENGLVYRLRPGGKPQVLYDAPMQEVHGLALAADGVLYAGAMSKAENDVVNGGSKGRSNGRPEGASAVYAIRPSGAAYEIWHSADPMLLAVAVDAKGTITIVTGEDGRIYRAYPDGSSTLLIQMDDVQPWAFLASKGQIWLGSSGAGKIYRLDGGYAGEGHLTSTPRDFKLVSKWGRAQWKADAPAGTAVTLQTRSGNSERPDDTWSDWSTALAKPGPIQSPPARFLQYRARLKGSAALTPRLREVTLAGQQENVRPGIASLTVTGPADAASGPPGPPNGGGPRPEPEAGGTIWRVDWSAADVNADPLTYTLYYRGAGERQWKLLMEDLSGGTYNWNTDSAPEGTAQVKLVVSDEPGNPPALALSAAKVSEPFEIDHSPPTVVLKEAQSSQSGRLTVSGRIEDATSSLKSAAYSLNAGPWQVIFAADGIFDSNSEELALEISDLESGEYTIVVRSADALGNIGVARRVAEVK